jgi:hypothetical protein
LEGVGQVDLVRQAAELKLEKIGWLRVLVLLWLVNFRPNLLDICMNLSRNVLKAISSLVKVSQHEQEFFG